MSAYKDSAPFVISETLGTGDSVVLGSADALLQDVRRLLDHLRIQIDELNDALKPSTTESAVQGEKTLLLQVPEGDWEQQTYANAKRRIADTLILILIQARNLFHSFPRLDRKARLPYSAMMANRQERSSSRSCSISLCTTAISSWMVSTCRTSSSPNHRRRPPSRRRSWATNSIGSK